MLLIASYFDFTVANEQLRGKTDVEKAQIIQWFGFADSEILPASSAWVFPLLGIMPYNKQVSYLALFILHVACYLFKRRNLIFLSDFVTKRGKAEGIHR